MTGGPRTAGEPGLRFPNIEPILPQDMALRAEEVGIKRTLAPPLTVFILSMLAGSFISFGAMFATTVGSGAVSIPYGFVRLATGLAFSVGLLLVIVGGAELFTGNNMMVMAWANRKITTRAVLFNWLIVYAGNCVGALAMAVLAFLSTQYTFGGGAVGLAALATADAKAGLAFVPALALGVLCNALVCLAVWMCYAARTTIDRVATIVPPIAAFAACGFEHSIANVFFIPMGLLIKTGAPESFWSSIGREPAEFAHLTWSNFLLGNLLPVTIGNAIGGSVFVAAVYWLVYLRPRQHTG